MPVVEPAHSPQGVSRSQKEQIIQSAQNVCMVGVQVLQPRLGGSTFKALSTLIRLLNNIVGGMSFVTLAKIAGVQKSGED